MKKMKKIVFIITFISSISCYSQVQDEYKESNFQGQEEVSQHDPKVDLINSSSVGQTIKIGNLEIMKKDLGFFNWDDANAGISALGGGWRLPTKKELPRFTYIQYYLFEYEFNQVTKKYGIFS
jgi:hypothetical protein